MEDKELIERLYRDGKMPAMYYYQLNGKTEQENYIEILRERRQKFSQQHEEKYPTLDKQQKKQLREEIEKAVADILKSLKTP